MPLLLPEEYWYAPRLVPMSSPSPAPDELSARIFSITRPDPNLLIQYCILSLSAFIAFPLVLAPLLCKYFTLRYRFDPEGVSMSWGLLFRKEINLTYSRIQDIHLSRGLLERWLDLGTLGIQTASGSAEAEMSLPGLRDFNELRDFLYARMRGHRHPHQDAQPAAVVPGENQVVILLQQIHEDLQLIRKATLEQNTKLDG
jgi:putative membrane protein